MLSRIVPKPFSKLEKVESKISTFLFYEKELKRVGLRAQKYPCRIRG